MISDKRRIDASELLSCVRPKLLRDATFLSAATGLELRFRGRRTIIRGERWAPLMTRIASHLDGILTSGEIADRVGEQRAAVCELIGHLVLAGVVIEALPPPDIFRQDLLPLFREQVEFLEHFCDRPYERFQRFRNSRILLIGSGIPLQAAITSLVRNGATRLIVDASSDCTAIDEALIDLKEDGDEVLGPYTVARAEAKDLELDSTDIYEAVCYVSDLPNLKVLWSIVAQCRKAGLSLVPGYVVAGRAFVGPIGFGNSAACWFCFMMRLANNSSPGIRADLWRTLALESVWDRDVHAVHSPVMRVLGNSVAFELFRLITGYPASSTRSRITDIDLRTLEMGDYEVQHYPLCPLCSSKPLKDEYLPSGFLRAPELPKQIEYDLRLAKLSVLIGERAGTIIRYDDDHLVQTPIYSSTVKTYVSSSCDLVTIAGFSTESHAAARIDAVRRATAQIASNCCDSRQLVAGSIADAEEAGCYVISAERLDTWVGGISEGRSVVQSWSVAHSLLTRKTGLVPSGSVFPCQSYNRGLFNVSDFGVGAGWGLGEACREAVLSAFAFETLKNGSDNRELFGEIVYQGCANVELEYLINVAPSIFGSYPKIVGSDPARLFNIVLVSCAADRTSSGFSVGWGWSHDEAAIMALRNLIGARLSGIGVRDPFFNVSTIIDRTSKRFAISAKNDEGVRTSPCILYSGILETQPGSYTDIVVTRISTPDVEESGIVVVRALLVR